MKKLLLIFVIAATAFSCKNKELCIDRPGGVSVKVVFDWAGGYVPAEGLQANIFSLDGKPNYGIDNMESPGGVVNLEAGSKVRTLAYSYKGNNLRFRNDDKLDLIEAYTPPLSRATYTKAYPLESTFGEPASYFYIGDNPSFDVVKSDTVQQIVLYPKDVIQTYTFRVEGIEGAEFIADSRGAISGISSSIFISTKALSKNVSTLLFNSTVNKSEGTITGSFKTFGRINTTNTFTIEILYPASVTSGLIQKSWDVTSQIDDGVNHHILIRDSGTIVPDEGGGTGGDAGMEIEVGGWGPEITIPLN